jgi:hypothetical protein
MRLQQAILILRLMGTPQFRGSTEDIITARYLGIEALERLRHNRRDPEFDHYLPLRHETEVESE